MGPPRSYPSAPNDRKGHPHMPVDFPGLHDMTIEDLRSKATDLGISDAPKLRRADLVFEVGRLEGEGDRVQYGRGVLEVHGEGFGFLRSPQTNFLPGTNDIYVSQSQIRRFKLKTGDSVIGQVRPPKEGERYVALLRVESINGDNANSDPNSFESLTAIYPDDRIEMQSTPYLRAIDLAAPLGLGQRGILLAPQRAGRVELLRRVASQLAQDDDLHVTILLIGERPEEIHEWRKATTAEVIATPFDEPPSRHVQVADIVFERARAMVARGEDAVLLVDSLSRLMRFCLAELTPSGRTVGGVDTATLHRIRRYMGAARALEEGGSLTVIGSLNSDPENVADHGLYEDLRDVVNWELTLSREVFDSGIHPPIDVHRSGTRREERLLSEEELETRRSWRTKLSGDLLKDAAQLASTVAK